MANNSIKSNLDKNAIISSIKLSLGADLKNEKYFVVVEGEEDWRFLRKFLTKEVIIYESYSGKKGVNEIVSCAYIDSEKVIGIRDRDYCSYSYDRIYYYDYSCMEMMIIKDDKVCEALEDEFYDGSLHCYNLRNLILKELFPLSCLRKMNEEKKLGIKFKGISIDNVLKDDFTLSISKLKENLERNNRLHELDLSLILDNIINNDYEKDGIEDLLKITNGHDFINYFSSICNKSRKSDISKKQIAPCLRSTYDIGRFKKTDLYNSIERNSAIFLVKN